MADIFISYASEDRGRVKPLANGLLEQQWSVFWDRTIPGGKTWDEVIEEELDVAKCVIVVWSKISTSSRWVRAEAEEGLKRNILVPVLIEDIKIPLLFRPIQAVRLINWQEDSKHPEFEKLISDLSVILGPSPLKLRETEQKRAEEEQKRRQEEAEAKQKAEEEKRRKEQELKRKAEEERQKKEAEAKRRAEEDRKRREIEAKQRIKEERKRKEQEQKRIEAARKDEQERKQEEAEAKHEPEEERKHRELKAKIKVDKPKVDTTATTEPKPPKTRKTITLLKFYAGAGVIMLLVVAYWYYNISGRHRLLHELTGHTSGVESVSFSPDGKTLASGSFDKTIRLWDVESEKR